MMYFLYQVLAKVYFYIFFFYYFLNILQQQTIKKVSQVKEWKTLKKGAIFNISFNDFFEDPVRDIPVFK